MVGKMMGAMKAARASEPHPETHSRILVAGTCLSFSILGETSERSCPEEADGGDLAAGQHPKPPFSLLSHLPILCGGGGGGGGGGAAMEEEDEDDGGGRRRSAAVDGRRVVAVTMWCRRSVVASCVGGVCVCAQKDIFWSSVVEQV